MMAKGTFATIVLTTPDLEETFDEVQASGAEVTRSPPTSPGVCGTAPSATRPATTCASTRPDPGCVRMCTPGSSFRSSQPPVRTTSCWVARVIAT